MNEYLAIELIRQRTTERYEEARHASLIRGLRRARRQRHHDEALIRRPIPDYVDGTYATVPQQVNRNHVEAVR